jgi:hypothetical protein
LRAICGAFQAVTNRPYGQENASLRRQDPSSIILIFPISGGL